MLESCVYKCSTPAWGFAPFDSLPLSILVISGVVFLLMAHTDSLSIHLIV